MAALLGCDAVSLEYPTKVILKDVTLGVAEGDRIGIVGKNGDGKSTLLRCLLELPSPMRAGSRIVATSVWACSASVMRLRYRYRASRCGGRLPEYEWAASPVVRSNFGWPDCRCPLGRNRGELSGGQRRRVGPCSPAYWRL